LKQPLRMGRTGRLRSTRELVITALPYIVVYRVRRVAIQVARVLHGAQMWPPDPRHELLRLRGKIRWDGNLDELRADRRRR